MVAPADLHEAIVLGHHGKVERAIRNGLSPDASCGRNTLMCVAVEVRQRARCRPPVLWALNASAIRLFLSQRRNRMVPRQWWNSSWSMVPMSTVLHHLGGWAATRRCTLPLGYGGSRRVFAAVYQLTTRADRAETALSQNICSVAKTSTWTQRTTSARRPFTLRSWCVEASTAISIVFACCSQKDKRKRTSRKDTKTWF